MPKRKSGNQHQEERSKRCHETGALHGPVTMQKRDVPRGEGAGKSLKRERESPIKRTDGRRRIQGRGPSGQYEIRLLSQEPKTGQKKNELVKSTLKIEDSCLSYGHSKRKSQGRSRPENSLMRWEGIVRRSRDEGKEKRGRHDSKTADESGSGLLLSLLR